MYTVLSSVTLYIVRCGAPSTSQCLSYSPPSVLIVSFQRLEASKR